MSPPAVALEWLKPLYAMHSRDSALRLFVQNIQRNDHLQCLLGLRELLLSSPLGSLSSGLGVKDKVPPPEAAGVVSNELLVVHIVMFGAGPEGEEVVQAPGELVTTVRIDSLGDAEDDPCVHGQNVEILGDGAPKNRATDGSEAQNHDLDWRRVFSSETERSRVLVVDLVDLLVQEWDAVHRAMRPVMPGVLQNEENCNLESHLVDAREGDRGLEAEVLAHGVEQPDLGKFDREMREEYEKRALCLLPSGRDFVLFPISI
jgi:hypothetical protein